MLQVKMYIFATNIYMKVFLIIYLQWQRDSVLHNHRTVLERGKKNHNERHRDSNKRPNT